jgi:uncharacterized protein YjiS (DUF1127 family)
MSLFRRRRAGTSAAQAAGIAPRQPHAGLLRRERRALLRLREERLRDLGGLVVEMYRRGAPFREDLLAEGCAHVVGIDARIAEIDDILTSSRATCTCGAPVIRGSHFCPNCGRALDAQDSKDALDDTVIERADGRA